MGLDRGNEGYGKYRSGIGNLVQMTYGNRKAHRDMDNEGLSIYRAANGWIVRKGCGTFVFDTATLSGEIVRYLHNPDQVEKEYSVKYSSPITGHYSSGLETAAGIQYKAKDASSPQVSEDRTRPR